MTRRHAARRRARGALERLRRYLRYTLLIPVFRSPHPPEYTARGVASGVFWGLTPSVGLQTIQIVATWFVARRVFGRDSSLLQAMIWVWVNNPITMLPMYYAFYVTGLWLLGSSGSFGGYDAFVAVWEKNAALGWWAGLTAFAHAFGLPIAVGCVPYAAIGAGVSYQWALRVVMARKRRITKPR